MEDNKTMEMNEATKVNNEENRKDTVGESKTSPLHYDAFISYRHTDLDKFVAENLHKQLEAYRMPADVAKKRPGMKNKIERVFRDQEELPLTSDLNDPIMTALHNSDWLIVICSPRLRESVWCKKEIETFINLNGREKVLAVLVEGEPAESFPEELLFKTEKITKPDGTVEEVKIPVEPLAADVRGKDKKEVLKNMKLELLRILAAMFHVNFDDLRQRHREQEHKRKMRYMTLGAIICLLVAMVSVGVALQLNHKNSMIQQLSDNISSQHEMMKAEQAKSLAELSLNYLEEGDREAAIDNAIMALTEYEYMLMPYTPEAQYALTESLRAYDLGNVYRPQYQLETMGIVLDVRGSKDGNTLAVYDYTGTLVLYNLISRDKIFELPSGEEGADYKDGYVFLDQNRFAYCNARSEVKIFDINKEEIVATLDEDPAFEVYTDPSGKYLVVERLFGDFMVYDAVTLEYLGRTPETENGGIAEGVSMNEEGILAWSYDVSGIEDICEINFVDCNTMELLSSVFINNVNEVTDIVVSGNTAYVLASYNDASPTDAYCYVCAIDIQAGTILWEDIQQSCTSSYICLSETVRKDDLLVITTNDLRLMNKKTGEVTCKMALRSPAVHVVAREGSTYYEVFCEDGTYLAVDPTVIYPMEFTPWFDCKTDQNRIYCVTPYEILVVANGDNHITAYTRQKAEALVLTEDKIEIPELIYYKEEMAQEKAKEYNLENANYVYSLFTDESQEIVFASYYNGDIVIYDTYQDLKYTIEDHAVLTGYFGKDSEGYTYVSGGGGGYVLSPDYKPVMFIPHMVALDLEQRKVYISGDSGIFEAPIYSSMDLIQMAAPYMDTEETENIETTDPNEEN